ncbi:MAG: hypothetical protein IJP78_07390 [Clostridia bacterium]|nr:hypothetical protein [Clostridia bacterium]
MKSFFGHLACLLAVLAVLFFVLYPHLSDQREQAQQISLIESFEKQVKSMSDDEAADFRAAWEAYNQALAAGAGEKQLPEIETVNGLIAVLEVPEIGVRLPVYPAGNSQARDTGVIHAATSALPTGEKGTRTLLAGNNGRLTQLDNPWIDPWLEKFQLFSAQLLHRLDQVKQGTIMYLFTPCGAQAYEVVETQKTQAGKIRMPEGENAWLAVMTNLGGQERQLVYGKRLSLPANSVVLEHGDGASIPSDAANVLLIGSPVLAAGLVFMLLVELFRRRHYRLPADSKKRNSSEG